MLEVLEVPANASAVVETQEGLKCFDCNCDIEGAPQLAGDIGHDDDYGPVPVVAICADCLERRR